MQRIHLDIVDSTNNYAREILKKITTADCENLPLVISARKQTAGRGRQGHTFYSPENTGVYMTFAHKFEVCEKCPCPTAACAVAVYNCLKELVEKPEFLKIKWVNDIYYDGKKICGILTESYLPCDDTGNIINKYIITGIGINISTKDFPEELEGKAGSALDSNLSCDCNLSGDCNKVEKIINDLPEKTAKEYLNILTSGTVDYMETYRANSFVLSKKITYTENGTTYNAKVVKINDDASLTAVLPDGTKKIISSGEISYD